MKQTDIAYIAGLVDGEGYIGVKRVTTKYNGRVNPAYQERIQIRMVDEQAIKFISDSLGGSYYEEKPHAHKGRPLFCYQASDRLAVRILKTLLPYLKVKKLVAEKVLEFHELRANPIKQPVKIKMMGRWGNEIEATRYRFSPEYLSKCEQFWTDCSDLNHGK